MSDSNMTADLDCAAQLVAAHVEKMWSALLAIRIGVRIENFFQLLFVILNLLGVVRV